MTYKKAWITFREYAEGHGYRYKVVGDEAFTNRKGEIIRLKSVRGNLITVYAEGIGIFTIKA